MIVKESRSRKDKEVTQLGGTIFSEKGYKMDVDLWFRHKNEALFYLDTIGKVHGPNDESHSIRLGRVHQAGTEVGSQHQFFDSKHFRCRDETKHVETLLRDVSSNGSNNCQKSFTTTATHIIPRSNSSETHNYSSSITKQDTKPKQSVTVNFTTPIEVIDETSHREKKLLDDLLEARSELSILRRTISLIDNSVISNKASKYNEENYDSKSGQKDQTQHQPIRKDGQSMVSAQRLPVSTIQNSEIYVESEITGSNVASLLNEVRRQNQINKPYSQPIPVNFCNFKSSHTEKNELIEDDNSVVMDEGVERSLKSTDDKNENLDNSESTVTITRKITRRQKGASNMNTLRNSYIEQISSHLPSIELSSDTDDDRMDLSEINSYSEVINSQRAEANESLPTAFEPIRPIVEEEIISQKKVAGPPFENLSENETQIIDNQLSSVNVPINHQRQFRSNGNSDETFITERQVAAVSTYSARKENMKSQQMQDERSVIFKNAQSERNVGHRNEMTEEIETITLQPIGKGVQNLALLHSATMSRPISRATTPKVFDGGNGTFTNSYFREERKQMDNYNTMPSLPKFAKTNSVRNVIQSSNYDLSDAYQPSLHRATNDQLHQTSQNRVANEYTLNVSPQRDINGLTANTSWKIRNESYNAGNRTHMSPVSPASNYGSIISGNMAISSMEDQRISLQMVINSEKQWNHPGCSRDDVIGYLRDKSAGIFVIRTSSTFADAYGLALKVSTLPQNAINTNDPQGDLVRHFLIESVEDASGRGVRLKGLDNEMIYPSLAHLVHAHCQHPIALPIRLCLPRASLGRINSADGVTARSQYQYESHQGQQQYGSTGAHVLSQADRSYSSPGVNFMAINHPNPLHQNFVIKAMYLGKVEVDKLNGDAAIERAVNKIMAKSSLKTSSVEVVLDSTKGITINDKMEKLFFTRQFPVQHVQHAGFDPKQREFSSTLLHKNGIKRGRIMGIVVKKQKMILRENVVHLFCESDDTNQIGDAIVFINENYLNRNF